MAESSEEHQVPPEPSDRLSMSSDLASSLEWNDGGLMSPERTSSGQRLTTPTPIQVSSGCGMSDLMCADLYVHIVLLVPFALHRLIDSEHRQRSTIF